MITNFEQLTTIVDMDFIINDITIVIKDRPNSDH